MALQAVLGVCTYGFILKGSDTIFPNVYVAGVNVGGLKREAAITAVEGAVNKSYAADTLHVILPDRTLDLDPEITNVALNADAALDAAMTAVPRLLMAAWMMMLATATTALCTPAGSPMRRI